MAEISEALGAPGNHSCETSVTQQELIDLAHQRGGKVGKSMAEAMEEGGAVHGTSCPVVAGSGTSAARGRSRHTPGPKARARPVRHEPGRMNKTEAAHARWLDFQIQLGEVTAYWFESVKLRLADKTWLVPDFLVMLANGTLQFEEVKGGFVREDSIIKLKVAASMYPLFRFVLCQKSKSGWTYSTVSAK